VKKLILIFSLIVLTGCGPSRFVAPLEQGENAIGASLGGPIINVPGLATIPIPMSSITYGHGWNDDLTLFGSWFTTAAVFGTMQLEVGGTYRLWEHDEKNYGFSVTPAANFAMDFFEFNSKLWPQLDANFYWWYNHRFLTQEDVVLGKRHVPNLFYAGLGSFYELSRTRAHNEPQQTWVLPMLQIGHDYNWKKWSFKTEVKIIAPHLSNDNIVVNYVGLTGDRGATGLYFGFTKRF